MYPVLFHIGSLEVRAWGVMVAFGIMAGSLLAGRLARKRGLNGDLIQEFVIYAIVAGLLGSRLWEVVFSWSKFVDNPASALAFWSGGLSIQGAVAGGLLAAIWFIRKHKLNFWEFADILAPGVILGQAIGRIGCFLNGDAYGIPAKSWFGVVYKPGTPAYDMYGATPLIPAELLEGAGDLAILGILLFLFRRKAFNGLTALSYFVLYSLLRFALEFWRGDSLIMTGTLKAAQVSSLAIALAAAVMIVVKLRKTA